MGALAKNIKKEFSLYCDREVLAIIIKGNRVLLYKYNEDDVNTKA